MQVKRFVAADMRRALEMVRQELGPDAIILSSNRIPEGVELLTTMGSDYELQQLQNRPFADATFSPSAPLLSDGDISPRVLGNPQARKVAPVISKVADHPNAGKTGAQLADDIEKARQRMIAAKKAEESAKEFLVGKNTVVNAGIPRNAVMPEQKPRVGTSAAERYPLVDPATAPVATPATAVLTSAPAPAPEPASGPNLSPESLSFRDALMREARIKESYSKDSFIEQLKKDKKAEPVVHQESVALNSVNHESTEQAAQLSELQAEIADMRFLLEQQLDRLSGQQSPVPNSPILASVARRLERLNLPQDVIAKVITACTKTKTLGEAWPDALANLAHQLPVNGSDIVDQGGVFAFVGPTGVGKTTTIGKLAARYVLQHGADKVALITTDTYRIAAHDQLRSLARILRVPVRVVDETNPLDSVLRSLRHCSLVLIDTAGFRHGDPHLKAQLQALAEQQQVKTYLVMSCNSQAQMLKASVHAYGTARLQGCILTKLDETASIGEALGVVMQNRLPIVYTTDGQDIPKHLEVARAHQLVSKAVALLKTNPATAVS
ncbi:flagellar biosynthesis protein FlhF [Cellvibrio sp. pealriver]|uniref:flagellar biosynthesis protein FlhF n=1 Tax=Cellvibrio sp. pealriver TaxID=1622269 RepID=UPI00066FE635|nr:flagellar biosynthesis protein FlhF [Cellvibrio sp. pealriver]